MKKLYLLIGLILLLAGCAAEETFETLGNVQLSGDEIAQREILLELPEDASVRVIADNGGRIYFCNGYEIAVEVMSSGSIGATVQAMTGYSAEKLTVITTNQADLTKHECVWTCAGENGEQVGRLVILDDGKHHYCLSLTTSEKEAGSLASCWKELCDSFDIE